MKFLRDGLATLIEKYGLRKNNAIHYCNWGNIAFTWIHPRHHFNYTQITVNKVNSREKKLCIKTYWLRN